MDTPTEQGSKLWFARVCIEFSIQSNFPKAFKVRPECGEVFEIQVEYGWIPRKCEACGVFEHSRFGCPSNRGEPQKQKWIPIRRGSSIENIPRKKADHIQADVPLHISNTFNALEDAASKEHDSLLSTPEHSQVTPDATEQTQVIPVTQERTVLEKESRDNQRTIEQGSIVDQGGTGPPKIVDVGEAPRGVVPEYQEEQLLLENMKNLENPDDPKDWVTPVPHKIKRKKGNKKINESKSTPNVKTRNQKRLEGQEGSSPKIAK